MMHVILVATMLIAAVSTDDQNKPWFCHDNDCPSYRVVKTYTEYELRCYNPATWVTTLCDFPHQKELRSLFGRLFDYITGANEQSANIAMTAPVLTSMFHNDTTHLTKSAMSFFLPPTQAPIKPRNNRVSITTSPELCVYVHSFDGRVRTRSKEMYKKLSAFSKEIKKDGNDYIKDFSFFAGYDSPWRKLNRHNELWRLPKCDDCMDKNAADFMSVTIPYPDDSSDADEDTVA